MCRASFGPLCILSLLICSCAGRHTPGAQAGYRIIADDSGLVLTPPALPSGGAGKPVPFAQILPTEYGFNPWEQYVDLSPGMRLAILRMTIFQVEGARDRMETAESTYEMASAGSRLRLRPSTTAAEKIDQKSKHFRLFYQTKFVKAAGQPVRPAVVLWGDSLEGLAARTEKARENPSFSCGTSHADCMAFGDRTTVSPEVRIVVNQKPRYVMLGWTVRDVLRAERLKDDADIRMMRRYRKQMVPVFWDQKAYVMGLPLIADDELTIGQ